MAVFTKARDTLQSYTTTKEMPWRWYHGLVFYVVVQALTFGFSGLVSVVRGNKGQSRREMFVGDVPYFRSLKQSIVTPPSWAFGPAWTINNISVIWGMLRVLNMPQEKPGRSAYLALQTASWLDFVFFNAAYFSLRSPINALILTFTMFCLTIASGVVAIFGLKDTKVALSLGTLFVWLLIALTAAFFQAAWNRDDFYQVGPFLKAPSALVREAR